jgi:HPt (histidine-containing phosphotransfer) domain-containing protein
MSTLIFDRAHFAHMTGDDAALQLEIIDLFRGQVSAWRSVLTPENPAEGWRDAVHTLKGSARGIGLGALAEACETAEAATEHAAIATALTAVHAALANALEALDAFASQGA